MMISKNEIEVIRGEGINHFHTVINLMDMKDNEITTDYELKVGDEIYKDGIHYKVKQVTKSSSCTYNGCLEVKR